MEKIATLLPKVLRKRGLKDEVDASHVVHIANLWLKEHGAPEDAAATKYKNGTVIVTVQNSVSSQECHGLSQDLLKKLRIMFPALRLEKILILRNSDSVVG